MPVAGNPQVNIRLEPELYSAVKESAESQGIKPHEWIRRVIKEKLGLGSPVAVGNTATDPIALTALENRLGVIEGELESLKKL